MWSFRLPHPDHYMLKLCSSQCNLHQLVFTKNQEYQYPHIYLQNKPHYNGHNSGCIQPIQLNQVPWEVDCMCFAMIMIISLLLWRKLSSQTNLNLTLNQ